MQSRGRNTDFIYLETQTRDGNWAQLASGSLWPGPGLGPPPACVWTCADCLGLVPRTKWTVDQACHLQTEWLRELSQSFRYSLSPSARWGQCLILGWNVCNISSMRSGTLSTQWSDCWYASWKTTKKRIFEENWKHRGMRKHDQVLTLGSVGDGCLGTSEYVIVTGMTMTSG